MNLDNTVDIVFPPFLDISKYPEVADGSFPKVLY